MDKIEFRKRVYANPGAPDDEVVEAARNNPEYQMILDEARELDSQINDVVGDIPVPAGLKDKLLSLPVQDAASGNTQQAANDSDYFQYFAIAASLILAVGVTFSLTFNRGPSSSEIVFGNEVLEHLYLEVTDIDSIGSGQDSNVMALAAVNNAMSGAGTQLVRADFVPQSPIRFAKPCNILPAFQSAHLIIEGSQGAVSVIVINNSPVSVEYQIRDERFAGVVVPMGEGNMILVGEQDEDLEDYKDLFADNVEWAI